MWVLYLKDRNIFNEVVVVSKEKKHHVKFYILYYTQNLKFRVRERLEADFHKYFGTFI